VSTLRPYKGFTKSARCDQEKENIELYGTFAMFFFSLYSAKCAYAKRAFEVGVWTKFQIAATFNSIKIRSSVLKRESYMTDVVF
jgi:hypothetical protein